VLGQIAARNYKGDQYLSIYNSIYSEARIKLQRPQKDIFETLYNKYQDYPLGYLIYLVQLVDTYLIIWGSSRLAWDQSIRMYYSKRISLCKLPILYIVPKAFYNTRPSQETTSIRIRVLVVGDNRLYNS
jgi:hypothetical protein